MGFLKVLKHPKTDWCSSHSNLCRRLIFIVSFCSEKPLNLYMRMIKSYLLFTFQKKSSFGLKAKGGEIQKGRHLKEAFNIYPHPAPNQPTEKHGYKTTDVNSMHHKMRCYHMTRKLAMFALGKRPKSFVFIRLTV